MAQTTINDTKRPVKYTWVVISAMVVGTIVGSGIIKDTVSWAARGGSWAYIGVIMVWAGMFVVGLAMADNISIFPENGGVYAWSRETMGRFGGVQTGWIYLIAYTGLSVILSWIAYKYVVNTLEFFLSVEVMSKISSEFLYFVIPILIMAIFTFIFALGKKKTTQAIIAFFTIKITMWLTLVGIGLMHHDPSQVHTSPTTVPLEAIIGVGSLSVWAMLGLDSCSTISKDIHQPGKNGPKGIVIGLVIVLVLYLSTTFMVLGLTGQAGAETYQSGGIPEIFLTFLNFPEPVVLVFTVLSITGTLLITMYLVVRLTKAMCRNHDFIFNMKDMNCNEGDNDERLPYRIIISQILVYACLLFLIYVEQTSFGTYVSLNVIYYGATLATVFVMFLICVNNFLLHRNGTAEKNKPELGDFRLKGKSWVSISIIGMVASIFIIFLVVWQLWTSPAFPLPTVADSYAYVFWGYFVKIFPFFFFIPGTLAWFLFIKRRK